MATNSNGLSVDQLAANLEKCAALVKQNNKGDPLLRQTIHDLTYFITGKRVSPRSTKATVSSKHASPASSITSTLGKMVGGLATTSTLTGSSSSDPPGASSKEASTAAATSAKNAARAKADLQQAATSSSASQQPKKKSSNGTSNWCDEHLTRNCSCQNPKQQATPTTRRSRPEFRRPTNPKSSLVANGWIEQQRRSKMRTVWKQVIMSLVEGKEGHGPALWIQREIMPDQQSGSKPKKPELEALHQIPAGWILDVAYSKYSTDNQFKLNVKNIAEEFVFRCPESAEAAQDWVVTIRSIMVGKEKANTNLDDWEEISDEQKPREESVPASQPKPAPSAVPPATTQAPPQVPAHQEQPPPRMSIKELRAIAHGAGITTHGMERGELERLVHDVYTQHHRTVTPEIPSVPSASSADGSVGRPWDEQGAAASKAEQELLREQEKQRAAQEEAEKKRAAEAQRRREIEEQTKRAEEQRRHEEEERRRLEAERRRKEEEEHRKRVAEMQAAEQRRREEEQRRLQQQQWAQQQQEWKKKQEEEMQKRQAEELRQAEERRRQEEAFRQQQQWQQHQQQAAQHHAWQQQQQQQTPFGPHYGQVPPPQHPQAPPAGSSPVNMKYAKMATQVSDGRLQHIKHSVLVEWALQPPTMQILRSIEILITSIHSVFPPKYGVAPHPHFGKWAVVPMSEVVTGTQPDNEKLKKAVRKLRFFLHPDKLPREFSEEQSFVCKMLWDITSDAYEEFKKREEELGWMRG